MKKLFFLLLTFLLIFPSLARGQVEWFTVRDRIHATDCTSLTDGYLHDLCYETDARILYRCEPAVVDTACDTPAEWIPVRSLEASSLLIDGTQCNAGEFPRGVNKTGDAQNCTDATTEINALILAHRNDVDAHQDLVSLDVNADTLLSLLTQELGLDVQSANEVFAGPVSGGDAVPVFRSIVDNDIPDNITITETDPNALLTAGIDNVKDTHLDWGTGANQISSEDVPDHNGHSVRDTFVHIINRGKAESITITLTGGLGISWGTGELYDGNTDTFFSTDAGSGNLTNTAENYLKWVSGTTLTISTTSTSGDEILISPFSVYEYSGEDL